MTLIDIFTGKEILGLQNLYTPEVKWIDNNTLTYIKADSSCNEKYCTQLSLSLNKYSVKDKSVKTKKIADKSTDGTLPLIDDIEISNNKASLGRRNKIDNKNQLNIDVDINF